MKKLLLSAIVVLSSIISTNAQTTILAEPFGTNSIPGGWAENTPAIATDNWKFSNAFGTNLANYVSNQGYCTFVDDWDNNPLQATPNWDTLKSPSMNCSTFSTVYISLNFMFWMDDGNETGTIAISTNGGATWTTAINLPNTNGAWANGAIFDISTWAANQANVMVAFTYYDGFATATNGYVATGAAVQNVTIYAPANYDLSVATQNSAPLMQVGRPYNFSGTIDNLGGTPITSMNMNYSVNGGPAQTQTISGISGFNGLTVYNWSMNTTPYTPLAAGNTTIKYWADNLNGSNADQNNANDTLTAHFLVVDSIQPKQVMFEEFSCASCNPCMYAMPNIDSVAANTISYCNTIRYHWYFPGQDMINDVTSAICNGRMNTYYGQYGVPDAQIDGVNYYPGYGSLSSAIIQQEAAVGSPFKIDVTSATYAATGQTFSLNATIKSFGTFPSGLKAQVYLTEDSVDFKTDQSTEDPITSFVFDGGTNPNYYYDFVLNFPDAVEAALPSISGTNLSSFTPGSTQTVSVSWAKNHAWADHYATYHYDSANTVHMTIFIQDNNGNPAAGIPAHYVYQSKKVQVTIPTGMQEISKGVFFEMYPNPTTANTNIALQLDKEQNVTVEVFNMLGEKVYSDNQGNISAGNHTIIINGSSLQNGVYFVRFNSDNATTTQKLIIQR